MSIKLNLNLEYCIPDFVKIEKSLRMPELGPKILFFSGGSALRQLSQALVSFTYNSIHLITPFDDGGSSRELRKAFQMPAVGDFRNRLMALADRKIHGNPEVLTLFSYRFSLKCSKEKLLSELDSMIDGGHELVSPIPNPLRKIIRNHLLFIREKMPNHMNLGGASIGNLIIVGGYLNNGRHLDPVLYLFSKLIECKGIVRPIVSSSLHLAARLENNEVIYGQSNITKLNIQEPKQKIKEIYFVKNYEDKTASLVSLRNKVGQLIDRADLIVYPIGSFFTSILVNLLVSGVGSYIINKKCPKVYVPNIGKDPEQFGYRIPELILKIYHTVKKDMSYEVKVTDVINIVLIDPHIDYITIEEKKMIKEMGIHLVEYPLVNEEERIDENCLIKVLISLT